MPPLLLSRAFNTIGMSPVLYELKQKNGMLQSPQKQASTAGWFENNVNPLPCGKTTPVPIRLFSTLSTSPTCSEQHAKLDAVVFPYIRLLCLLLSEIVCNFGATVAKTDNIRLVHRETTFYFMFTGIELYEMTHSHHNSSLLSNSFCFFVSSLVYWPVFVAFALPIIVTFTLPVMSLNTGGLDSSFDPPGWNLTNASRSQLMSLCGQWGIRAKRKTIDTVQMIRRMVREQRRSVPIQKYLTNAPGNVTCIDDASRKRRESNYEDTEKDFRSRQANTSS